MNQQWLIYLVFGQLVLVLLLAQIVFFPSDNQLKKDWFASEVAVLVSPHSLREYIEHGENPYVLIDVREKEHYELGHIIGAYNIPPDDNMIAAFKELQVKYPDQELLIYCYTQVCMRGRKVGKELAKHGIYVREIGIGFQEWKNDWQRWNYEWEWPHIQIDTLIQTGKERGTYIPDTNKLLQPGGCSANKAFGC